MEVYTQVPDKTTRDALKRLSDLLGEGNTEATTQNTDTDAPNEGTADGPQTAA
jgi:hypothetical protein